MIPSVLMLLKFTATAEPAAVQKTPLRLGAWNLKSGQGRIIGRRGV